MNLCGSVVADAQPVPGTAPYEIEGCGTCGLRTAGSFCTLAGNSWREFATAGTSVRLQSGGMLFFENDPSDFIYVLCSGQLKLSCMSREGRVRIVRIAMPGDVLGLGAAASGMPYEVSAKALVPTQAKVLRKREFMAFLQSSNQASMEAMRSLSREYKSAFFDARRLSLTPSASGRLASVLLELANAATGGQPGQRFTMALTHEDLAGLAGLTRETVTRLLAKLQIGELIRIKGASMTILAPEELSNLG